MNDYARQRMMRNRRDRLSYPEDDYERRRDYEGYDRERRRDYGEYDYERDYHNKMKLDRHDLVKWKKELKNANGTRGGHFEMSHIIPLAEKMGARFDGYDEADLCMTVNMLYSDFCEAVKGFVSPDKELPFFVKIAIAWLEDEDAPEGSEKLALYKYCIVESVQVL